MKLFKFLTILIIWFALVKWGFLECDSCLGESSPEYPKCHGLPEFQSLPESQSPAKPRRGMYIIPSFFSMLLITWFEFLALFTRRADKWLALLLDVLTVFGVAVFVSAKIFEYHLCCSNTVYMFVFLSIGLFLYRIIDYVLYQVHE